MGSAQRVLQGPQFGTLEHALTEPETYADGSRVADIRNQIRTIDGSTLSLTEEWETLSEALEGLEDAFRKDMEELGFKES